MQTHFSTEEVSLETSNDVSNIAEAGHSLLLQEAPQTLTAPSSATSSCLLDRTNDLFKVEKLVVSKLLSAQDVSNADSSAEQPRLDRTSCKLADLVKDLDEVQPTD